MKIQVIGSGCATCKNLYELTKKAVIELELKEEVEYSTDITKLIELGVMTSPVLVVDGKVVMTGSTNSIDKVKELLHGDEVMAKEVDSDDKPCCDGQDCECDKDSCDCDKADCDCKKKDSNEKVGCDRGSSCC